MVNEPPKVVPNGRYSPREAASILGISVTSVYRYMKNNVLKAMIRPTGGFVVTGRELTRFWGGEYI